MNVWIIEELAVSPMGTEKWIPVHRAPSETVERDLTVLRKRRPQSKFRTRLSGESA